MTTPQPLSVPGQRDWTLDPGRRIHTLSWEFRPGTLRAGRWPGTSSRLFAGLAGVSGTEVVVGAIRRDDTDGWVVAVAVLVDGNVEARAQTPSMAVAVLREHLTELASRGVRIAVPAEHLGTDPFNNRRVLSVSMQAETRAVTSGLDIHKPEPEPDILARLDVPAPVEEWYALCDAWDVPRTPDALVRAVRAATWDRATASYLADRRAAKDDT